MFEFDLNYWAILVSGLSSMIIGGLWYSPLLFGNMWAREAGWTKEAMEAAKKKKMTGAYVTQFITALVASFVLAHFVYALDVFNFTNAMQLAFWIWLGFQLTQLIGSMLWENKSGKFVAINAANNLVTLAVSATILAYWR